MGSNGVEYQVSIYPVGGRGESEWRLAKGGEWVGSNGVLCTRYLFMVQLVRESSRTEIDRAAGSWLCFLL